MNVVICFLAIKQFECDKYNIRSLNHEMYLQKMRKYTLSQFDVIKVILLNGCKTKENFEKTRHVKNNDRSKKPVLKGQRNII